MKLNEAIWYESVKVSPLQGTWVLSCIGHSFGMGEEQGVLVSQFCVLVVFVPNKFEKWRQCPDQLKRGLRFVMLSV